MPHFDKFTVAVRISQPAVVTALSDYGEKVRRFDPVCGRALIDREDYPLQPRVELMDVMVPPFQVGRTKASFLDVMRSLRLYLNTERMILFLGPTEVGFNPSGATHVFSPVSYDIDGRQQFCEYVRRIKSSLAYNSFVRVHDHEKLGCRLLDLEQCRQACRKTYLTLLFQNSMDTISRECSPKEGFGEITVRSFMLIDLQKEARGEDNCYEEVYL